MNKLTVVPDGTAHPITMSREDLGALIRDLHNAMGSVSVMEHAAPNDVAIDEPDFKRACRAIYADLAAVSGRLTDLEDGAA